MTRRTIILGVLLTLLLAAGGLALLAAAQPTPSTDLRVIRSTPGSMLVEFTAGDFQIESIDRAGLTYQRVQLPGTVQTSTPGAPQVPTRGALLGLPALTGLSLEVLEADYETRPGYRLDPAPGLRLAQGDDRISSSSRVEPFFTLDPALYGSDAFYPASPAQLGQGGYLRDQAVAQVRFYPVRYNPVSGELRLYRRVRVRIRWDATAAVPAGDSRPPASPVYERLLSRVLANYPALERPPLPEASLPALVAGAGPAAVVDSDPALKLTVTEGGLYRLAYGDLAGAGFDPGAIDPRALRIHYRGAEIPIYVHGQADGRFDAGDYLLFYAPAYSDRYTAADVYWLSAGPGPGQRMPTRDVSPAGGAVPAHFPAALHAEQDTHYWQSMPDGAGQDHWFWGDKLSAPASRPFTVTLDHVSTPAVTATVRVGLKGRTALPALDPDHHTRVYLNGTLIDDRSWDGQLNYEHVAVVSHALLHDGANTITVESVGDTGAVVDQIYVNWIALDYWAPYVAAGDALLFGAPSSGTFQFQVANFSADARLFDVTNPAAVTLLTGADLLPQGATYTLRFQDAAGAGTRYLALTPARFKTPARVALDRPSSWRSPASGADYIIVTHADFYTSALRLAAFRAGRSGMRVATVQVEDIYDEFNYGRFNPQAIRDFLTYAYHNWTPPAPTFVLLVGDANHDYRDNLHTGTPNYVPSQIVETDLLGETPSDNWYARVSGDDILPDLLIGRLSAQQSSQVDDIVDKIIDYERNPPDDAWNRDVLLVADDDEPSFEDISEQIAALLAGEYAVHRVYASDYPPGDPTADILAHVDDGSVLVNYTGHGHVDMWGLWDGSNHILDSADLPAFANAGRLPLVTVANCLNGFFTGPGGELSLAEAFQRLQGRGAVAVWASTGLGYPSGHRALMGEFYSTLFQEDEHVLGVATAAAKIAAYDQNVAWGELVQTFVLFGDPAQFLGFPAAYPYVQSTLPENGATGVPIDAALQVRFNRPMQPGSVTLDAQGLVSLPVTPTWSADNTWVTYAHPLFDHGQALTLTVSGQDQQGQSLGLGPVPRTWSFSVTDDSVPPAGVIGVEGGRLSEVPLNAALIVTFTEPMRADSLLYSSLPALSGGFVWDAAGQVARFHHAGFVGDTPYTFTVSAARDLAGNPLLGPLQVAFRTQKLFLTYLPLTLKND